MKNKLKYLTLASSIILFSSTVYSEEVMKNRDDKIEPQGFCSLFSGEVRAVCEILLN